MRNAIKKIEFIKKYHSKEIIEEHPYLKLRNQLLFSALDVMLSFYTITLPIIVQGISNKRENEAFIFMSEIIAIFFFIDMYL